MELENNMEKADGGQEVTAESVKPHKKNNALIIAVAVVLGVVLLGGLGLAVIMGTDGIPGFEGIKLKVSGILGNTEPTNATQGDDTVLPQVVEPDVTEPLNLKSYTVDASQADGVSGNVVATMGDYTLTNADLQAYYETTILSYYSQNYYYLMYSGIDLTQPLDQIVYDPNTNETWQEFMLESALSTWKLFKSLRAYGETSQLYPYTFTEAGLEYVNNLDARIMEMATSSGYADAESFVKEQIGITGSVEGLKQYMEDEYYYVCYYNYLQTVLLPTMEQIETYFAENTDLMASYGITKTDENVVDVRHILIMPEATTDANGAELITDQAWDQAKVEAEQLLEQWETGEKTEDSFAELANAHTEDPGSQTTGGLYTAVTKGSMVTEFDAWIFAENRAYGDYEIVKTDYGYHLMFFVRREPKWVSNTRTCYLNEKINNVITEAEALYEMVVDYESIALSH